VYGKYVGYDAACVVVVKVNLLFLRAKLIYLLKDYVEQKILN